VCLFLELVHLLLTTHTHEVPAAAVRHMTKLPRDRSSVGCWGHSPERTNLWGPSVVWLALSGECSSPCFPRDLQHFAHLHFQFSEDWTER